MGKKRQEEKESSGGWLGGWFGGGKKDKKKKEEEASDASELGVTNSVKHSYLLTYLRRDSQLLKLSLTEICASFGQRPAASAIRLDAKVERLRVNGVPRGDYLPKLISSVGVSKEENSSLLMVAVETNPQDGLCDSRIRVQSRPLEIIYDAITVNNLASFFKPPESVRLKQLSNAAMARYDIIKAQTTAGMMHMMDERKYADIEVNLMPSYIIVPATGELRKDVCLLLLNLGSFNISSEKTAALTPGTQYSQQELENYSYDKFNISLDNLQLLYIQPDNKLLGMMKLVNSIPLPESGSGGKNAIIIILHHHYHHQSSSSSPASYLILLSNATVTTTSISSTTTNTDSIAIMIVTNTKPFQCLNQTAKPEGNNFRSDVTNFTKVSLSFVVKEISAELRKTKVDVELTFLRLSIHGVGVNLKARTFDLSLDAFVGGIYLQHLQYKLITGELINIINSPDVMEGERLLSVSFLQLIPKVPSSKTTYNNTAQAVTIEFSTLDLVQHQGVVLNLLEFVQKLQPSESASKPAPATSTWHAEKAPWLPPLPWHYTGLERRQTELFQMRLKVLIDGVQLSLCNKETVIMHTRLAGTVFFINPLLHEAREMLEYG
ncbi:vacuolar protein sorting-associated protein 13C [Elysia marginata]|uniref:Vacuolar protein sorting-associated protein 13C n=1 Tax=Elysia marginata TaxID=1093978 RepID=A0AAV4JBR9_9GAST|nr:vacuolar protein sorting-associated protein 13C [Elysia marginata]